MNLILHYAYPNSLNKLVGTQTTLNTKVFAQERSVEKSTQNPRCTLTSDTKTTD